MDRMETEEGQNNSSAKQAEEKTRPRKSRDSNTDKITKKVYLPGDCDAENTELVCDKSAYVMLHHAATGSPCLSFDVIPDNSGNVVEDRYPLTSYVVAGTQAPKSHANDIIVMKMTNIHKTQKFKNDDDDDDDDDSEESSDDERPHVDADPRSPQLSCALISHQGCVNRVRSTTYGNTVLAATWSELGRVNIWNLVNQLQAVDDRNILAKYCKTDARFNTKPLFTFRGHQAEGFALDWSSTTPGVLASGDCKSGIHIWHPSDESSWLVDQRPLVGHTASVEDLQWSPNEKDVLASCSTDRSIRIWDVRSTPNTACKVTVQEAHAADVNVINWNKNSPFIVSGGDDGVISIWDLRYFKTGSAVASFKHHLKPVTTVEWHPEDDTVFASGGEDDQIVLWDLSVEKDEEDNESEIENLPSQLLFIHQGQKEIKELHWHPQHSGVIISTALDGFNIFQTISV